MCWISIRYRAAFDIPDQSGADRHRSQILLNPNDVYGSTPRHRTDRPHGKGRSSARASVGMQPNETHPPRLSPTSTEYLSAHPTFLFECASSPLHRSWTSPAPMWMLGLSARLHGCLHLNASSAPGTIISIAGVHVGSGFTWRCVSRFLGVFTSAVVVELRSCCFSLYNLATDLPLTTLIASAPIPEPEEHSADAGDRKSVV